MYHRQLLKIFEQNKQYYYYQYWQSSRTVVMCLSYTGPQ